MEDNTKPTLSAREGIAPKEGDVDPLDQGVYKDQESEPISVPTITQETKKFNRHLMLVYFSIAGLVIGLASFALRDQLKPFLPAFLLGTDAIATTPIDDQMIEEMATAIIEENTATPLPTSPTPSPSPFPTPTVTISPEPPKKEEFEYPNNVLEADEGQCIGMGGYDATFTFDEEKLIMIMNTKPKEDNNNPVLAPAGSIIQVSDTSERDKTKSRKCMYGIQQDDGSYNYYFEVNQKTNNIGRRYFESILRIWNRLRDGLNLPRGFQLIGDGGTPYDDDLEGTPQGEYYTFKILLNSEK